MCVPKKAAVNEFAPIVQQKKVFRPPHWRCELNFLECRQHVPSTKFGLQKLNGFLVGSGLRIGENAFRFACAARNFRLSVRPLKLFKVKPGTGIFPSASKFVASSIFDGSSRLIVFRGAYFSERYGRKKIYQLATSAWQPFHNVEYYSACVVDFMPCSSVLLALALVLYSLFLVTGAGRQLLVWKVVYACPCFVLFPLPFFLFIVSVTLMVFANFSHHHRARRLRAWLNSSAG